MKAEVAFWLICTALGAFNDWNSVVRHQIYDYTVPHFFSFSSIPIWMLLFWGMILRFFVRLARWKRLSPPTEPNNRVGFAKSPILKIIAQLILVFATRQAIYKTYMEPIWSWLPFAITLIFYLLLFHPTRHDFKLLALAMFGGPLVEILYIQVGGLHVYHLGWIGGVPLWIAVWWMLIIVIWKDLALRIEGSLKNFFS